MVSPYIYYLYLWLLNLFYTLISPEWFAEKCKYWFLSLTFRVNRFGGRVHWLTQNIRIYWL